MGFFNSCWEAFLQLTSYAHSLGPHQDPTQQPLPLPDQGSLFNPRPSISAGVSFPVAGTNFTCHYPSLAGYQSCNTAQDRTCWLKGPTSLSSQYDINTDYENSGPRGIQREYWLEVDLEAIAPDGYLKVLGQVFNNSYPGPHIQACWGDELVVHVKNKIPNLGTTVHWHGIRQLHTNQQDGVNGVTQCPIAVNQTYTYRFNLTQYGHTWYHSHYQTQYSDGEMGPLTIYGPSSAPWDETETPIHINDWVHQNTSVAFREELTGGIPVANSILFNGTNTYKCADNDPHCCSLCNNSTAKCAEGVNPEFCCTPDERCFKDVNGVSVKQTGGISKKIFEEGKRYLFKLINSSAEAMFIFSIDDHELEVIATDLVPIHPYTTDSLFIGIGQRYQVVVTAKPKQKSAACAADSLNCNYWIRTRIATGCGTVEQDDETTGIVVYNASSTATPTTFSQHHRTACQDEDLTNLQPVFHWNVSNLVNDRANFTFDADISDVPYHGAFRWDLASQPLFLNYSNPTILNLPNSSYLDSNPNLAVVNYTFGAKADDGYAYLVITGAALPRLKTPIPAAHPIHLHGHDFVILSQVDSKFNGTIPPNQTNNPPRRDVALLYSGGYLALAFKLDNPGVWLVHCHIAWHASSGLALQILERQEDILPSIGSLSATKNTCKEWEAMDLKFAQDDSGI